MTNLVQFPALGLSFTLNRVAFSIGGINIYWYGVCIAVGMCLALVFAFRHGVEFGVDADAMVDVILIGVVMGILCARLYYVPCPPTITAACGTCWPSGTAASPSTAASSAAFCSAALPVNGARCRCCLCSTLRPWASSSGRAVAAGATSSIRRHSAATRPCRGACTAKRPTTTCSAAWSRPPRHRHRPEPAGPPYVLI